MSMIEDYPVSNPLEGVWVGIVATDAADINDPIHVIIPAFDDLLRHGPCRWVTRGSTLPQRGQDCMIAFDNEQRPVVIAWWDGTGGAATIGDASVTNPKLADNSVTSAKILDGTIVDADVASANKDGTAGTPSLRTLGTGATQAASGTDSRLGDARTPTSHKTSHEPGGGDALTLLDNSSIKAAAAILGSKLNWSVGSSPPGSPSNNDIWIYNGTSGVYWMFIYDSSETTYKWKYVGGGPINTLISTAETTSSGTYVDLTTVGPTLTVPRGGDYEVEFGFTTSNSTAGIAALGSPKRGGSATVDADAIWIWSAAANQPHTSTRSIIMSALSSSTVIKIQYRCGGGTQTYQDRWMKIKPIRVI